MGVLSINSNLSAQAATRRLGQVDARLGTALERLSTGMRINRSSDDPAGLAVSSTLETRGRLYSQADRNIRDGLSLIDVLDGALAEQSNILIRLSELAEQSANGSLSNGQRQSLQIEYQQLQQEFARIAATTVFNGQKLSQADHGGASTLSLQTGISGAVSSLLSTRLADTGAFSGTIGANEAIAASLANLNEFDAFAASNPSSAQILERYGMTARLSVDTGGAPSDMFLVFFYDSGANTLSAFGLVKSGSGDTYEKAQFEDDKVSFDSIDFNVGPDGLLSRSVNGLLRVQTGTITFDYAALRLTQAATSALEVTGIETVTRARFALDASRARLSEFSTLRGQLGATASRLNTSLALTAANKETNAAALSRIRDVDVAAETSQMATQQILRQAATAVLAQANQQPALALRLLT